MLILGVQLHHDPAFGRPQRAEDLSTDPEGRNSVVIGFHGAGQRQRQPADRLGAHAQPTLASVSAITTAPVTSGGSVRRRRQ
jgi:hypothetical protein